MKLSWIFSLICLCAAQTEESTATENSRIIVVPGEPDPPVIHKPIFTMIHSESIYYSNSIITNWLTLTEVPYYRRTFTTTIDYEILTVEFLMSLVGNSNAVRSRIQVYLDDDVIYDTAMANSINWAKMSLLMKGYKMNVPAGTHTIKLVAAVNGGNLYIPQYDDSSFEGFTPKYHAKLFVLGFN